MQKELAKRDRNKETTWRIDFMENFIEIELVTQYGGWLFTEAEDAQKIVGD